ncbi:Cupin 2 conserved barrel domain protein [Desulfurobacterium thermolithotrophum DSM 11699]|uniref:Cupin 2 conserved barrel domain protein n=1 Tax=Desulfurobacterium thermolithotrophum (strain DSM 11699 / BSA) TaxID=868864 RepID=F0S2Q5_DESTD|nr:cupin domain-containing protein [Desulfurobacterium thermolithotrophum]ADY73127.1 Cupin 2 conserved barrel domain protein [Desulfurobacterium thermolithotrophum DSM 11699]
MAFFYKKKEIKFEPHPKFEGVGFALLIDGKKDPRLSVSMLAIEPGVEIPIHIHETQADSIYVLEGKGEVYINGEWQEIDAGDYVLIPPGEKHGVRSTGSIPLKLFIVHTPPLF